jgi:hypothetical protein
MNIDGSGIAPLTASLSLGEAEGLPDWGAQAVAPRIDRGGTG